MTASFRRIDYSLRPSKHAERRMLVEIFGRLRSFQPVDEYVYAGLGSVWFVDFSLFHRALGIKKMISFERQVEAKQRIDANKPFALIEVDYRSSTLCLPDLDWHRRHFLWMDYDDPLAPGVLTDARSVAARAKSGTVFAVSVQTQRAIEVTEAEEDPGGPSALERFRERFGPERMGQGFTQAHLSGWLFAKAVRRIVSQEIEGELVGRNNALEHGQQLEFIPICAFEYEDGVKMTTLVGAFVARNERVLFEACGFGQLDFVDAIGDVVRIPFPKITPREAKVIEQSLPWAGEAPAHIGTIPQSDAKQFAEFYRYWPSYAVLES